MWTLENALRIVRVLQPVTRRYNYHLTLGGGVLNKGESQKDLDLYFLPMGGFNNRVTADPDGMLKYLETMWGASKPLASDIDPKESCYKHAVQLVRMGGEKRDIKQRIDCFIF